MRSLSILIVCLTLTSCVTTQPAPETAQAEVQRASDAFWSTRQSGDAASLAAQFTEQGILMVPGLPDAVGRAEVRELLQKRMAGAQTTDFRVHRREITVAGDSAHELAWFSEISRRSGESMRMEGHYLLVWKRVADGHWRVHRYMYNFSGATPV